MALPLPPGLAPPETAFLCEMELVTIIPRQRLPRLSLLGGPTPPLHPPHRAHLPLWLALLLKRQRGANIVPPPWLTPPSLHSILDTEKTTLSFSPPPPFPPASQAPLSPPFLPSATAASPADRLPYHWLEMGEMLLEGAGEDVPEGEAVRRLMRDLREVRGAKMRAGVGVLEGGREVNLNGVGGLEVAEGRAFIAGVVDGLRVIGGSREMTRREREMEEREGGVVGRRDGGEEEDDGDEDYL